MPYHYATCGVYRNYAATTTFNLSSSCQKSDDIAKFKAGELIIFFSNGQCGFHYGVFLGHSKVAHLTLARLCRCEAKVDNDDIVCRDCDRPKWGQVTIDNIHDLMEAVTRSGKPVFSKVVKDTTHSGKKVRYTAEEIGARARDMVGPTNFKGRKCNCEHFATWCVYGKPVSVQTFYKWKCPDDYKAELKGRNFISDGQSTSSEKEDVNLEGLSVNDVRLEERREPMRREREG